MSSRIYQDFAMLEPHWSEIRRPYRKVVFTNGCFDILHAGHVTYLEEARALGDFLVLGLNSDASVSRLKGPKRPLNLFEDRATVLAGLRAIDLVVGFEEDTPYALIGGVRPDILVKGGDWSPDQIVGSDLVSARGGEVRSLVLCEGRSTTGLVERVIERYGSG